MKHTLLLSLAALLMLVSCERRTTDLTFCRIMADRSTTDSIALELRNMSNLASSFKNPVEYRSYDIQFPKEAINDSVLRKLQLVVLGSLFADSDTTAESIDDELKLLFAGMNVTKSDTCPLDPRQQPENLEISTYDSYTVRTITNTKSLYTFSVANDQYSFGAAHGLYSVCYYSCNSTTGNRLTFDSLFTAGADSVFHNFMLTQIPIDFKTSYGQEFIFHDEPYVTNGSFYFTEDGLHFSFAPYVIGSYADGQIDCLIPADEVKPHLKPEWKRLFEK